MNPTHDKTDAPSQAKTFVPPVDVCETPEALLIIADLPGVEADAVDVTAAGRVLTVKAHAAPHAYPAHRLEYAEYESGDFARSFHLPEQVDQQRIRAELHSGVLRLTIPKGSGGRRKIPISTD